MSGRQGLVAARQWNPAGGTGESPEKGDLTVGLGALGAAIPLEGLFILFTFPCPGREANIYFGFSFLPTPLTLHLFKLLLTSPPSPHTIQTLLFAVILTSHSLLCPS